MLLTVYRALDRANFNFGSGSFGQVTGLASGFRPRQLQVVARFEF